MRSRRPARPKSPYAIPGPGWSTADLKRRLEFLQKRSAGYEKIAAREERIRKRELRALGTFGKEQKRAVERSFKTGKLWARDVGRLLREHRPAVEHKIAVKRARAKEAYTTKKASLSNRIKEWFAPPVFPEGPPAGFMGQMLAHPTFASEVITVGKAKHKALQEGHYFTQQDRQWPDEPEDWEAYQEYPELTWYHARD